MKQRPIDLLPDAIRARSQAGVVAGRYVAATLIAVVLLGLTATHSRLLLDLARQRLKIAEDQADIVLAAEAKARRLQQRLEQQGDFIRRYELIAYPLEASRIIAAVVNELPESATLDRLDLHAGPLRQGRSARGRRRGEPEASLDDRKLVGEVSGFAATDLQVAEIVARLDAIGLFEQVNLDFSRTRTVRGRAAREFRISFRADLEARYEVVEPASPADDGEVAGVE